MSVYLFEMKKTLVFLLMFGLFISANAQAGRVETDATKNYPAFEGGQHPNMFTSVFYFATTDTNTPDKILDAAELFMEYEFSFDGKISGTGDIYYATSLIQFDSSSLTPSNGQLRSIYIDPLEFTASTCKMTVHFTRDVLNGYQLFVPEELRISVILVDEIFNDPHHSVYAMNSQLEEVDVDQTHAQFDFSIGGVEDSPFFYVPDATTTGCGAVKVDGKVRLQVAGCGLYNFYTFVTGFSNQIIDVGNHFFAGHANLLDGQLTAVGTPCSTDAPVLSPDSANIFRASPSDQSVGLWICYHGDAADMENPAVQVSMLFVGVREFSANYPTQNPIFADNFKFYSADADEANNFQTNMETTFDTNTIDGNLFETKPERYGHIFCGFTNYLTSTDAFNQGFDLAAHPPTIGAAASNTFTIMCIWFERSDLCAQQIVPLQVAAASSDITLTEGIVSVTATDIAASGSAQPSPAFEAVTTDETKELALSGSLYFKIELSKAPASATIKYDRTATTATEFLVYVATSRDNTAGSGSDPIEIKIGISLGDESFDKTTSTAQAALSETEHIFHSTDPAQNTFTISFDSDDKTDGDFEIMQVVILAFENVLDGTTCVQSCPAKDGFTTGSDLLTQPPTCLQCDTSLNRVYTGEVTATVAGSCKCAEKYYEDATSQTCLPCTANLCLVCDATNPLTCTSCVENAALSGTVCSCIPGYFASNGECVKCPIGCTTCTSEAVCTACVTSTNADGTTTRDIPSKACACLTGFYETGVDLVCPACDNSCKTCETSPTFCTSCDTTQNFVQSGNTCICADGFYLLETATASTCEPCDSSCANCATSPVACVTCPSFRELAGVPNEPGVFTCKCIEGYIELYGECVDQSCKDVDQFCQECAFDPIAKVSNCLNCIDNRIVYEGKCECKANYFENDQGTCEQCGAGCSFCTNADTCNSCAIKATNNGDGTCSCPLGTVLAESAGTFFCRACAPTCTSCSGTFDNCQTCVSGFTLNSDNKCVCPDKSYESLQGKCESCIANCLQCEDGASCKTCDQYYVYNTQTKSCSISCPTGMYNGGDKCFDCPDTCTDCISQNICITCTSGNLLFAGSCRSKCPSGTFPINGECLACGSRCKTCTKGADICDSCNSGFTYLNGQCVTECPDGTYYADQSCLACSSKCLTCTGNSEKCTNCASGQFVYKDSCFSECPAAIVDGKCTDRCPDGKYLSGSVCNDCDAKCQTCSGSATSCTSCSAGTFSYQGNCVTQCPAGTLASGSSCIPCDSSCASCLGSIYTCTSCKDGSFKLGTSCVQSCGDGFYLDPTSGCKDCGIGCKSCSSPTRCTACFDPRLTSVNGVCQERCPTGSSKVGDTCICNFGALYQETCISPCPEGFYSNNKVCEPCTYPCATCSLSSTYCLTCAAGHTMDAATRKCIPVSACPYGKVQNSAGTCVRQCSNGLFLHKGGCISACPSGFKDNTHGGCVESSSSTFCSAPLFRQGNTCVASCQIGFWPNSQTRVCDSCPSSCQLCASADACFICAEGFISGADAECIVSVNCPTGQIQYQQKCYSGCPVGTYQIGQTCSRSCGSGLYFNPSNSYCYTTCPTSLKTPDACVNSCPTYTTLSGTMCAY